MNINVANISDKIILIIMYILCYNYSKSTNTNNEGWLEFC